MIDKINSNDRDCQYKIWIPSRLPGLNDIIAASKSARGRSNAYSRMKKKWTGYIAGIIRECGLPKMNMIWLALTFVERDRRRDQDNVSAGGKKFVLDALVKSNVIPNDGWRNIVWGADQFEVNKHSPGVQIRIQEIILGDIV